MEFGESQPTLQYPVYDMNKDEQGFVKVEVLVMISSISMQIILSL
jgi:hypothetical protein